MVHFYALVTFSYHFINICLEHQKGEIMQRYQKNLVEPAFSTEKCPLHQKCCLYLSSYSPTTKLAMTLCVYICSS